MTRKFSGSYSPWIFFVGGRNDGAVCVWVGDGCRLLCRCAVVGTHDWGDDLIKIG